MKKFMRLTKSELDQVTKMQNDRMNKTCAFPESGQVFNFLELKFVAYPGVFLPFNESQRLIENFTINSGDTVLDVCTGTGIIAIWAAYQGAKKVIALDINPQAVRTTQSNINMHALESRIMVKLSDMFEEIKEGQYFDVITGNLPFRNKKAKNFIEASVWDTNLKVHKNFFARVKNHLKPGGRIYLLQANFGAVNEMLELAERSGLKIKLICENIAENNFCVFYAFELQRL
jgi:release factor glutamine methyltransferase